MKISPASMHRLLCVIACTLFVSGPGFAETPPVSTRLILKGHDPVAYFTENKPVKGATEINYDWDDGRYLFSNAKNKQSFAANPDRYAPQFAGFCTAGVSRGMKAEANPELFMIVDGKLYTFSTAKARDAAQADPTMFSRAAKNWQEKK